MGFPDGASGKEPVCQCRRHRDVGSIPGSVRSHGEGNGNPLQYSCLGNLIDSGVWRAAVHGVKRVGDDLATKPSPSYYVHIFMARKKSRMISSKWYTWM